MFLGSSKPMIQIFSVPPNSLPSLAKSKTFLPISPKLKMISDPKCMKKLKEIKQYILKIKQKRGKELKETKQGNLTSE